MKPSEILRLAAKRVEDGLNFYAHTAIYDVGCPTFSKDTFKYCELVDSHRACKDINHLIVTLCMAAAIAESEGN